MKNTMTAVAALAAAGFAVAAHADNTANVGGSIYYFDTETDITVDTGSTPSEGSLETDGFGFQLFANGRYEKGNGSNLQLEGRYVNASGAGSSESGGSSADISGDTVDALFTTAGLFTNLGDTARWGGGFNAARTDGIGSLGLFGEYHRDFTPNFSSRFGAGVAALDGEADGSIFQANVGGFYGIGANSALTGDLFYVDGTADDTFENGDDTDVDGFGAEFAYHYNPAGTRVGKGFKLGYSDIEFDAESTGTFASTETAESEQFYFKFELGVSLTGEAAPLWQRRDGYFQYGNRPIDDVLFLAAGASATNSFTSISD